MVDNSSGGAADSPRIVAAAPGAEMIPMRVNYVTEAT
jgi:hypothetical protein